jgi:hypothetical protein
MMDVTKELRLIHDIANLNPYRHPLQEGESSMQDRCAFCGHPMHTRHDASCLWGRAVALFGDRVPLSDYRREDYR